jgi:hypothetical protein
MYKVFLRNEEGEQLLLGAFEDEIRAHEFAREFA